MTCKPFGTQLFFVLSFPFVSAVIMKEPEKLLGVEKKKKYHCKFGISLPVVRTPLRTGGTLTAKFTPKAAELNSAPYTTARAGRIHSLRCINGSIVKHAMAKGTECTKKKKK